MTAGQLMRVRYLGGAHAAGKSPWPFSRCCGGRLVRTGRPGGLCGCARGYGLGGLAGLPPLTGPEA